MSIASLLGLNQFEIYQAQKKDLEELDQPITPFELTVRPMAAVYKTEKLSPELSLEEALDYAKAYARETGFKCCLQVSKIRGIYVDPRGGTCESYRMPGGGLRLKDGKAILRPIEAGPEDMTSAEKIDPKAD